jgi:hypothetical protein
MARVRSSGFGAVTAQKYSKSGKREEDGIDLLRIEFRIAIQLQAISIATLSQMSEWSAFSDQ